MPRTAELEVCVIYHLSHCLGLSKCLLKYISQDDGWKYVRHRGEKKREGDRGNIRTALERSRGRPEVKGNTLYEWGKQAVMIFLPPLFVFCLFSFHVCLLMTCMQSCASGSRRNNILSLCRAKIKIDQSNIWLVSVCQLGWTPHLETLLRHLGWKV